MCPACAPPQASLPDAKSRFGRRFGPSARPSCRSENTTTSVPTQLSDKSIHLMYMCACKTDVHAKPPHMLPSAHLVSTVKGEHSQNFKLRCATKDAGTVVEAAQPDAPANPLVAAAGMRDLTALRRRRRPPPLMPRSLLLQQKSLQKVCDTMHTSAMYIVVSKRHHCLNHHGTHNMPCLFVC